MGSSHSKNDVGKTSSSMYSERRDFTAKILPRYNNNATTSIKKRPKADEKCKNVSIRENSRIKTPLNMKKSSSETRNNENSLVIPPSSSSSYPYPRGHSTVLVPSSSWNCRPSISSPIVEDKPFLTDRTTTTSNSGFNNQRSTKVVYFNGGAVDGGTRKTGGGTFVKKFPKPAANVCVPSPIYSCSEPSSSSVSRSETREFTNNAADPSSQDQQPSSDVELPAETNMNNGCGTAVAEPNKFEKYANLDVLAKVETKSSLIKTLIFTKKLIYSSTNNNSNNTNTNNELKRPTNFKMPIPKLSKSVTISNAWQVSKNSDEKGLSSSSSSGAPLAESESFIIENSPMIEIAPQILIEKQKLSKLPTKMIKFTPNSKYSESKIPSSKPPVYSKNFTPRMNTLAESRLQNSAKYTKMQNLIYGKFEKAVAKICSLPYSESGISDDFDPNLHILDENRNFTSKNVGKVKNLHNPNDSINNNNTTPGTVKSGHSTSGSDAGNSSSCKIPSPNGSFVRGIIDDEIHDQPDLSVGYPMVATGNDQASNTCTPVSMDDVVMTSYVSPPSPLNCDYESPFSPCVAAERQRSVSGVQCPPAPSFPTKPAAAAPTMSESIYSRASSSSAAAVDSDDLMLDFEDESCRSSAVPFADNTLPKKFIDETILKPVDEENSSLSKKKLHETEPSCSFSDLANNKQRIVQNGHSTGVAVPTLRSSPDRQSYKCSTRNSKNDSSNDDKGDENFPNLVALDQKSFLHLSQDVTVVKTLLFRLKRILQEAESSQTFENSSVPMSTPADQCHSNDYTNQVAVKDQNFDEYSTDDLKEENSALRTQVALLYRQLNEKDDLLNQNRRRIEELEKTLANSKPNGLCKNEISSRKGFFIDQR